MFFLAFSSKKKDIQPVALTSLEWIVLTRRNRNRNSGKNSFFSGVYTEFTGQKPLPKAVVERPVLFVLGPSGVGKTILAKRLNSDSALFISQQKLLELMARRVLRRKWSSDMLGVQNLILEAPCYIEQRPQILALLLRLIKQRVQLDLKTTILDAEDHGSLLAVLSEIPSESRATISLRFPVGRGRYRFLAHACKERGLPLSVARRLMDCRPWSYSRVFSELEQLSFQS